MTVDFPALTARLREAIVAFDDFYDYPERENFAPIAYAVRTDAADLLDALERKELRLAHDPLSANRKDGDANNPDRLHEGRNTTQPPPVADPAAGATVSQRTDCVFCDLDFVTKEHDGKRYHQITSATTDGRRVTSFPECARERDEKGAAAVLGSVHGQVEASRERVLPAAPATLSAGQLRWLAEQIYAEGPMDNGFTVNSFAATLQRIAARIEGGRR